MRPSLGHSLRHCIPQIPFPSDFQSLGWPEGRTEDGSDKDPSRGRLLCAASVRGPFAEVPGLFDLQKHCPFSLASLALRGGSSHSFWMLRPQPHLSKWSPGKQSPSAASKPCLMPRLRSASRNCPPLPALGKEACGQRSHTSALALPALVLSKPLPIPACMLRLLGSQACFSVGDLLLRSLCI